MGKAHVNYKNNQNIVIYLCIYICKQNFKIIEHIHVGGKKLPIT